MPATLIIRLKIRVIGYIGYNIRLSGHYSAKNAILYITQFLSKEPFATRAYASAAQALNYDSTIGFSYVQVLLVYKYVLYW